MRLQSKQLTDMAMMLALAMIMSYVEMLIPVVMPVYGMKLGIANVVIVITMYRISERAALLVNILRVIMVGFLFTNLYSVLFSIFGAVFSFTAMYAAKKSGKLSIYGVSITGAVFHSIGQIIAAYFVLDTYGVIFYLPVMAAVSVLTGYVIGVISSIVKKHLQ